MVESVAARKGWTATELADRTIPTVGFNEHGELPLDFGERTFKVVIDDGLKPALQNDEGKVIKALPKPRESEPAERVKEAKADFSQAKKDLKQILSDCSHRFYDAMCAQEAWDAKLWQDCIGNHPLAGRLAGRLLWQCNGECFVSGDDMALEGQVTVAHGALLSDEDKAHWQAHFKDNDIKPLFEQLTHTAASFEEGATSNNDFEGWLGEIFKIRGPLVKRGYLAGEIEDGGLFRYYFKPFVTLGLRAVIHFSGNHYPEQNVAAALLGLSVQCLHNGETVPLADVPPVLLSEAFADYKAAADKADGFDADWQQKIPW